MRKDLLLCIVLLAMYTQVIRAQRLPIERPEELVGRWETADGQGGMVGMSVTLASHFDGAPTSLLGHQRYLDELRVGLYQRRAMEEVEPMGFSFFANSSTGATWDGQHFRVLAPQTAEHPKIDIDLVWDEPKRQWSGRFQRGKFSDQVILKRPKNAGASPFPGAWFETNELMNNCLHIVQQSDGALAAWSDDISIPGRMRYVNGIKPPTQSLEHYGEIAKIQVPARDSLLVELRAFTATCCSHSFTAKLSADGGRLIGNWPAGPNQAPHLVEWKKMPEDSCFAAANGPALH